MHAKTRADDLPTECPHCEADEGHQPGCPLYLPVCPVCAGPSKRDGEVCGKCRHVALGRTA